MAKSLFRRSSGRAIIGHRGLGSGTRDGFRENTLPSMLSAIEAGASWIETDVRRTADNNLVLHHDATIDGKLISDLRSDSSHLRDLERFEALLEQIPGHIGLDIEIKPDLVDTTSKVSTTDLTIDALQKSRSTHPIVFTSFDVGCLLQARKRLPEARVGFLTWMGYPIEFAVNTAASIAADAVCVHVSSLVGLNLSPNRRSEISRSIAYCKELNIEIMVWGPKPEHIPELLDLEIDAVCVGHISETLELIQNHTVAGRRP